MQGKSTSFIGSRMGLLRVVGKHPAVEAAVFVWHAKRCIFRLLVMAFSVLCRVMMADSVSSVQLGS
jgi:hypothetical protein